MLTATQVLEDRLGSQEVIARQRAAARMAELTRTAAAVPGATLTGGQSTTRTADGAVRGARHGLLGDPALLAQQPQQRQHHEQAGDDRQGPHMYIYRGRCTDMYIYMYMYYEYSD